MMDRTMMDRQTTQIMMGRVYVKTVSQVRNATRVIADGSQNPSATIQRIATTKRLARPIAMTLRRVMTTVHAIPTRVCVFVPVIGPVPIV
jgi:hypothetical protein